MLLHFLIGRMKRKITESLKVVWILHVLINANDNGYLKPRVNMFSQWFYELNLKVIKIEFFPIELTDEVELQWSSNDGQSIFSISKWEIPQISTHSNDRWKRPI